MEMGIPLYCEVKLEAIAYRGILLTTGLELKIGSKPRPLLKIFRSYFGTGSFSRKAQPHLLVLNDGGDIEDGTKSPETNVQSPVIHSSRIV